MPTKNRYDLRELAGAFGDLGTLVPFVVAYVTLLDMDPVAILVGFGAALIVAGLYYRTPLPVQPMKAIGAAATLQAVEGVALGPGAVIGAGLVTGLAWITLAASGWVRRVAAWIPRPALLGVIMGLGFSFMLEGIRLMREGGWVSALLLVLTLLMLSRPALPAMLVLLLIGVALALFQQPELLGELAAMKIALLPPGFAWPALTWHDLWAGTLFLALPQLPLTFGNALVAVTEQNNRLFPDRAVSERQIACSTGMLNIWSSALGGVPMCHGAGGLAGHVQFGARSGGATVILGTLLLALALLFGPSVQTLFEVIPASVLGVILFLAGVQLATSGKEAGERVERFVVLTTAAFAIWNVGIAVVFGFVAYHASRQGWLRL